MESDAEVEQSLEQAVLAQAPPGALIVGVSVSPDRRFGASLTLLPSAKNYPMDDLFERVDERWIEAGGGSGLGISWSSWPGRGVLRFGHAVPADAAVARIRYEGHEYDVLVRHGHFFFVAWDTDGHEDPEIVAFDSPVS